MEQVMLTTIFIVGSLLVNLTLITPVFVSRGSQHLFGELIYDLKINIFDPNPASQINYKAKAPRFSSP